MEPHEVGTLRSDASTAEIAVDLAVGVRLILYGERKRRTAGRSRRTPAWLARMHEVSAWTAAGLAVLLQPWGHGSRREAIVILSLLLGFWLVGKSISQLVG